MKKLYGVLLIVAGFLLTINVILTSMLLAKPAIECRWPAKPKALPCESVPIDWAVTHNDCANSLLLAMNVTNVKFQPKNSSNTILEKAIAQLQKRSYRD
jgi:hypothetical protein